MWVNGVDDTALERLELKIAFLEHTTQELSDVVYRQQREIAALRAQMMAHQRQFEAAQPQPATGAPAEERPPHY